MVAAYNSHKCEQQAIGLIINPTPASPAIEAADRGDAEGKGFTALGVLQLLRERDGMHKLGLIGDRQLAGCIMIRMPAAHRAHTCTCASHTDAAVLEDKRQATPQPLVSRLRRTQEMKQHTRAAIHTVAVSRRHACCNISTSTHRQSCQS